VNRTWGACSGSGWKGSNPDRTAPTASLHGCGGLHAESRVRSRFEPDRGQSRQKEMEEGVGDRGRGFAIARDGVDCAKDVA